MESNSCQLRWQVSRDKVPETLAGDREKFLGRNTANPRLVAMELESSAESKGHVAINKPQCF